MRRSRDWYPAAKRAADLGCAILLLGPAAALLFAAMALEMISLGPPVFFVQRRTGRNGRPFVLVKLRSMRPGEARGRSYRQRARIGSYGRLVRKLHVDELPQLIQVLAGQMSMVGPRPLLAEHVAEAGAGPKRHQVRPGLACLAQLELARNGIMDKKRQIQLDEEYVDCLSLRLDCRILLDTLGAMLAAAGVAQSSLLGSGGNA